MRPYEEEMEEGIIEEVNKREAQRIVADEVEAHIASNEVVAKDEVVAEDKDIVKDEVVLRDKVKDEVVLHDQIIVFLPYFLDVIFVLQHVDLKLICILTWEAFCYLLE